MRRGRAVLAIAAAPFLALPLLAAPAEADTTSAFDAANLNGGCAALELTVSSGYQFVVQPDVQVPRATTLVQEGGSEALASPADPGDSTDTLAGLFVPQVEGYIAGGYPGAPSPFAGQGLNKLPAPLNSAGETLVSNPFNKVLTYPYEHADAGYPNPQKPGPQTATVGGTPGATVADPSGLLTVNGAVGTATAGDGFAIADGGGGAAATAAGGPVPLGVSSIPAFGLSVGRLSAHSEAHVGAASVTHDAACALHDVEIALPGAPKIHIRAVDAKVHTERALSAAAATGTSAIEFSGVTVDGKGATLDQHGLNIGGQTVPLNPATATPPTLPGAPLPAPVPAPPTLTMSGTQVTRTQPNANEMAISATGATLVIKGATPVPNAIPPSGVSATPTTYTLRIASLASEAYGLPASTTSSSSGLGSLAGGFAGIVGGGLGVINSGTTSATPGHPGTAGVASTLAGVTVTPGERWLILGVASVVEALLLAGVGRNYLRGRRRIAAPAETTDLP